MKKRHEKGFTLIELLVAIFMFTSIAAVVYSTFSTGTAVWERAKESGKDSMSINSVFYDLSRNLRNSVNYRDKDKELSFMGGADTFYFCCPAVTITEEDSYTELYRVRYYAEGADTPEGKRYKLSRKMAPIRDGGYAIDEIKGGVLLEDLSEFKIEYAYKEDEGPLEWKGEWEYDEDVEKEIPVPRAMRILVGKGEVSLIKYISIPAGKLGGEEEDGGEG